MLKLVAVAILALSANQILAEKLNCEGKVGTFLVKGCNKFYTMCSSNGAFLYECPSGLKFDYRRRLCDYTENIPECKYQTKYKNHVFEALPILKCDEREPDVNFVHPKFPCDNYYYSCSPGATEPVRQTCPYNQFFDETLNRCDFIERVKACKKTMKKDGKSKQQKRNQKISGYTEVNQPSDVENQAEQVQDTGSPAPPPSTPDMAAVEISSGNAPGAPDCSTVDAGVYRDSQEKCSEKFWKCSNEKLFRYKCQNELFYDAETNRCDHKSLIPDCGGVRQSTTPVPAQDAAPVDFDCTNKEDNLYVKESCTNTFYHCNGGLARKLTCPDGLVYDARINACDYAGACKSERPVAETPSLYDHGSVKQKPKKEEKITFDCSALEDGPFEEKKCVQNYIQCVSGQPHRMSCSEGLVYNKQSGNCDYLENCLTSSTTTAAPVVDKVETSIPSASPYSMPAKPIKKSTTKTTVPVYATTTPVPASSATQSTPKQSVAVEKPVLVGISCTNLADGPTALELCSANYVECWQGVGTSQKCPGDLIFNTYSGQCDYHDNVPGCGSQKLADSTPRTTTTTPTPITNIPNLSENTDTYCKKLSDGFHGDGCKNIFYHCSSGKTHKMNCPTGLFYDAEEKQCNHKEYVVACGAKPRTTTTAPMNAEPNSSPYQIPTDSTDKNEEMTTPVPKPTQPSKPIFECTGQKDGLYALPTCTDVFIQCHNEKTYERECQSGLFYNDANGMCDYKENVPSCGGSVPTVAPVTSKPTSETKVVTSDPSYSPPYPKIYNSMSQKTAKTEVKPTRPAPALSCVGKADGYYSAGCSPEYFTCVNGVIEKLGCPPVLRFSESNGRCDYAEFVAECGGSPVTPAPVPTTTNVPVEIAGAQPQSAYQPISKPAPVPTADSCVGKADGQYSQGCSQKYFTCLNGVTVLVNCPDNLRFSQSASKCDYPEHVEECGGKAPTQQTVTAAPSVSKPVQSKPVRPSFACLNKSDGFYSSGCESTYASCLGGRTGILKCPGSLKFSQTEGRCDFEERVPECGGTPPKQSPVADKPSVPLASIHSCVGKIDGYYSAGCSEEYYSCSSGIATTMNCPSHLRFNQETSFCDYPLAVTECGGSRPTVKPPKQSPVVPDFDCNQKSDGYYAVAPCSSFYASCNAGLKTIGLCPSSLKYNSLNGKCEFEQSVLACSANLPTSMGLVSPTKQVVATVTPASASQTPAAVQPQPEFSCVGRLLGNHALSECSQEYVQCAPYSMVKAKCPFGLVFNSATGYCDNVKNVKDCAQVAVDSNSASQSHLTCVGRTDGYYTASRCSSSYFRCVQGKASQYNCGTGLIFDQSQGVCNYVTSVQGC